MRIRYLPDWITLVSSAVMVLVFATAIVVQTWLVRILDGAEARQSVANVKSALAQGIPIDVAGLARLSERLGITNLHVADAPGPAAVPLPGADGRVTRWLVWTPPAPAAAALEAHRHEVLGLMVLGTLLAGFAVLTTRRSARALAEASAEAARAARTDALTGLPNRLAFTEYAGALVGVPTGQLATLFLDVNNFKHINDAVGHAAGDRLIVELAERLRGLRGEGEFVARVGGDEFVFVVNRPDAERRVRDLGLLVRERMAEPIMLGAYPFTVSLAQGFSIWRGADGNVEELVHEADLAMYHAKHHKIESPVRYDRAIESNRRETLVIEEALRRALDREGEFHVLYQPIIDVRTGRMAKAEALARWTSQEIGRVPPEKFIAVAEKSGLIVEVGQRLLEIICADLARYPELNVSINFSPLQLQAPTFIPELIDLMHRRKIETFRVEVEVTEGVIVDDPEVSAFRLDLLNEAGFSTALDDFGTGYSSLGYLRHMSFNTLKIDRSFISGITGSDPNADLIRAIAVLGHSLSQNVVAEGVETAAEIEVLRELGCDMLQGYHFDRPLPVEVLAERWIDQRIEIAS